MGEHEKLWDKIVESEKDLKNLGISCMNEDVNKWIQDNMANDYLFVKVTGPILIQGRFKLIQKLKEFNQSRQGIIEGLDTQKKNNLPPRFLT